MNGVIKWVSRIMEGAGALACCLMVINVFLDVFTTYTFNMPIPGTLEIVAYYYMIAVVFLPIANIERKNESICVELFYDMVMPSTKLIMRICAIIVPLLFYGMLCYQTWFDAVESFQKTEYISGIWNIVVWPGRFFLPISFAMVCIVLIARLIHEFSATSSDEKKLKPKLEVQ